MSQGIDRAYRRRSAPEWSVVSTPSAIVRMPELVVEWGSDAVAGPGVDDFVAGVAQVSHGDTGQK